MPERDKADGLSHEDLIRRLRDREGDGSSQNGESFKDIVGNAPELIVPPADFESTTEVSSPVPPLDVLPVLGDPGTGEIPTTWKRPSYPERKMKRLRSVACQEKHDYHYLSVREAWEQLNADLSGDLRDGLRFVEVVHGKGTGALKRNVRHWLSGSAWVLAYTEQHGNGGAVAVELKRYRVGR